MKKFFAIVALMMLTVFSASAQAARADYEMTGVVVLSRHNIRAPLSKRNSDLAKVTPHHWFEWTSAPSELSLHGAEA